jgi:hypothetical protein
MFTLVSQYVSSVVACVHAPQRALDGAGRDPGDGRLATIVDINLSWRF